MSKKIKLLDYLLQNAFFDNADEAIRYILAGEVVVDEHTVSQCGTFISLDASVRLKSNKEFVSRGAYKLQG
ncbi:MAG: TlyA family rRNA (cytidine-2'-O)-methyltransferase, partial [Clostridia bacterium]|nr:TlyA family rRNA (cytidine-2'-O)-methyltransferase [Clostridia bacterium]